MVLKRGFKKIVLDEHHSRSTVHQLKAKGRRGGTERLLGVIQVICKDGQAVGLVETIKLCSEQRSYLRPLRAWKARFCPSCRPS